MKINNIFDIRNFKLITILWSYFYLIDILRISGLFRKKSDGKISKIRFLRRIQWNQVYKRIV